MHYDRSKSLAAAGYMEERVDLELVFDFDSGLVVDAARIDAAVLGLLAFHPLLDYCSVEVYLPAFRVIETRLITNLMKIKILLKKNSRSWILTKSRAESSNFDVSKRDLRGIRGFDFED